jgi:hypothetical protein
MATARPSARPAGAAARDLDRAPAVGWLREETLVRCDDLFALAPPVELVVRNPKLDGAVPARCGRAAASRAHLGGPDGKRIVFTTQGSASFGGLDGSVCEAWLDGRAASIASAFRRTNPRD